MSWGFTIIDENIDNNEIVDDTENTTDEKENLEVEKEEAFEPEESSELALRMINSVKSLNSDQISHYEMVNAFTLADELKCLYLFIKSLPHNPILPMYPETPFLFFKGVSLPKSFNLTEEVANDIENFIKCKNSEFFEAIHLHDLSPHYLDAYESGVQMYNDMVEKARVSYLSSVKQAKSQVIEISAAIICGFIIILALIGMS